VASKEVAVVAHQHVSHMVCASGAIPCLHRLCKRDAGLYRDAHMSSTSAQAYLCHGAYIPGAGSMKHTEHGRASLATHLSSRDTAEGFHCCVEIETIHNVAPCLLGPMSTFKHDSSLQELCHPRCICPRMNLNGGKGSHGTSVLLQFVQPSLLPVHQSGPRHNAARFPGKVLVIHASSVPATVTPLCAHVCCNMAKAHKARPPS
jgi:hypothetical protein